MSEEQIAPQAIAESSEPTPTTFRDRKLNELAQERDASAASQPAELEDASTQPDDTGDSYTEEPLEEEVTGELETDPEANESNEAETDPEEESYTPREMELIAAAEKATEQRQSMEGDYRRKTQKLADDSRAVAVQKTEGQRAVNYLVAEADRDMARFSNVDWAQLRTDPERFQAAQQDYLRTDAMCKQRHQEREQFNSQAEQWEADNNARVADHSKGVLQHMRPDWGNELYGKTREWAERELDYSQDEFDRITDWRPMLALVKAMESDEIKAGAKKTLKRVGKTRSNPQVSKRNAAQVQNRDASGRFAEARAHLTANPGDKNAFRAMKMAQLQVERENKRNR